MQYLGDTIKTPAQERSPSVSPEGKYLFFTRWTRENDQDIYREDAKIIADIKKENNLERYRRLNCNAGNKFKYQSKQ
jgi:hypothetical protein